ncbi:hypothetical protein ACFV0T_26525 [Streptomyces sp. NPDC059582]|uniref:hypothetical protein n=1 Tax=Streptomyces sp. NPDC059582 TaxID=3346875 RepID=UPI0036A0D6C3
MTHAPSPFLTLPVTVDYRTLPTHVRNAFDQHMEDADHARTDATYKVAMVQASQTAGIAVPASLDIARCSCLNDTGGCGCGSIFDTALPGAVVTAANDPDCNLSQLQCPACGHDHPRPITD